MVERIGSDRCAVRESGRTVALAEELGGQLARLKGGGPKIRQFLSMLQLDPAPGGGSPRPAAGALPAGARAVPFGRVRRVIEQDLGARAGQVFDELDKEPFALASLGQVHRARTCDGDDVAVKVQHPGVAEAVAADLRNVGLIGPIVKRLAPGLDASALLAELRERISDELDYEIEAQHQRRVERVLRGHPHVRVPRVHTELTARRVLVIEYVEGVRGDEIRHRSDAERDRVGEIALRVFRGLVWRDGIVAGDPQPDNCILCPDGRLCLLDFRLLRDLDPDYVQGERAIMGALADGDAQRVHEGLSSLGYLQDPSALEPDALLEFLTTAGGWMLVPGFLRVDPERVAQILELGYPPRSPYFPLMRHLRMPSRTLLLRRMELQLVSLLGHLHAGGDWQRSPPSTTPTCPASTPLGREEHSYLERRGRR